MASDGQQRQARLKTAQGGDRQPRRPEHRRRHRAQRRPPEDDHRPKHAAGEASALREVHLPFDALARSRREERSQKGRSGGSRRNAADLQAEALAAGARSSSAPAVLGTLDIKEVDVSAPKKTGAREQLRPQRDRSGSEGSRQRFPVIRSPIRSDRSDRSNQSVNAVKDI